MMNGKTPNVRESLMSALMGMSSGQQMAPSNKPRPAMQPLNPMMAGVGQAAGNYSANDPGYAGPQMQTADYRVDRDGPMNWTGGVSQAMGTNSLGGRPNQPYMNATAQPQPYQGTFKPMPRPDLVAQAQGGAQGYNDLIDQAEGGSQGYRNLIGQAENGISGYGSLINQAVGGMEGARPQATFKPMPRPLGPKRATRFINQGTMSAINAGLKPAQKRPTFSQDVFDQSTLGLLSPKKPKKPSKKPTISKKSKGPR